MIKDIIEVGNEVGQRIVTLQHDMLERKCVNVDDLIELKEATENLLKCIETELEC